MQVNLKFVISLLVMYIGFMTHFYYDEKILSKKNPLGPFPHEYKNILLCFNFFFGCITAASILLVTRVKILRNPFPYLKASVPHFLAAYFTNIAKYYADYATLNVVKSAKPIAVMLCSIFLFHKKVPTRRIFVVIFLCIGLTIFGYTANNKDANNAPLGYGVISLALLCEGIYGPIVDQLNHSSKSPYLTMFYMQSFNLILSIITGIKIIIPALTFIKNHPEYLPQIAIFIVTNLVAQVGLFTFVNLSNGLILSIATTSRKFFTILLSSIAFKHNFTALQWVGIVIVFSALSFDIFGKKPEKKPTEEDKEKNE